MAKIALAGFENHLATPQFPASSQRLEEERAADRRFSETRSSRYRGKNCSSSLHPRSLRIGALAYG